MPSTNRPRPLQWLMCFVAHVADGSPGQELLGRLDYHADPGLRASWGGPLNGQTGRQALFEALFRAASFDAVVETGTYRGTTTLYLAGLSQAPVFTFERDPRHGGFAIEALRDLTNVQVCLGESVRLLPPLLDSLLEREARPFVYLDAHWGPDLPLAAELALVLGALPHAIVAVDDFRVPDDPGYGFDDYGPGATLDLETFAPLLARLGATPFFPTRPAAEETGMRRGVVLLAASDDELGLLRRIPLLRERPLP